MSPAAFLLGQAQRSYHELDSVDHPMLLMVDVARQALQDAGIDAKHVQTVACVDPLSWTYADLGTRVANAMGCRSDTQTLWLPAGGTTPQDLLHHLARSMREESLDVAVIVGAEAMRTRRKAVREGRELPWPPRDKDVKPMRGQQPFTSEWEAQHGLRLPIQVFPLYENALRTAHGRTAEAQIGLAAQLLHNNAQVAATNEHAWFTDAPSAEDIASVTRDNRMIAYPYTKRMNAIMDVDQAAAVVVVSARYLASHGDQSRAAAVLGGAGSEEVWNPIQRPQFATSTPMKLAFNAALENAGLTAFDLTAFDFYSCFPAPIQMALEALQLDITDPRPLSLTGGLAYAGGPGNNYVTHSLATALTRLRDNPDKRLLVTGVGMANTKHTGTVLAHAETVPSHATGETVYRIANPEVERQVAERAAGGCSIVTFTIEYDRDASPTNVIYILDMDSGERAIANTSDPIAAAEQLLRGDPIGTRGELRWDAASNRQLFELA